MALFLPIEWDKMQTNGNPSMLHDGPFSKVIALFHEAAVVPELWPKALDELALATGAAGALLWRPPALTINSRGLSNYVMQLAEEGWDWADTPVPRHQHLAESGKIAIWSSRDIYTAEEFDRDPFQRDFARRLGIGCKISGVVARTSDGPVVFCASRRDTMEPFTDTDIRKLVVNLLPGLRSAGTLAARFGFARSVAAASSTLEALSIAAVLVDQNGHVIQQTTAAAPALTKLGNTFLTCCTRNPDAHVHTRPDTGHRVVVRPVPVVGAANDLFSPATTILLLTDLDSSLETGARSPLPSVNLLRQAFPELTPAEAKFAACLATGISLEAVGAAMKLSRESARIRLKRIFRVTAVHRQGELVALLARLLRHHD